MTREELINAFESNSIITLKNGQTGEYGITGRIKKLTQLDDDGFEYSVVIGWYPTWNYEETTLLIHVCQ